MQIEKMSKEELVREVLLYCTECIKEHLPFKKGEFYSVSHEDTYMTIWDDEGDANFFPYDEAAEYFSSDCGNG